MAQKYSTHLADKNHYGASLAFTGSKETLGSAFSRAKSSFGNRENGFKLDSIFRRVKTAERFDGVDDPELRTFVLSSTRFATHFSGTIMAEKAVQQLNRFIGNLVSAGEGTDEVPLGTVTIKRFEAVEGESGTSRLLEADFKPPLLGRTLAESVAMHFAGETAYNLAPRGSVWNSSDELVVPDYMARVRDSIKSHRGANTVAIVTPDDWRAATGIVAVAAYAQADHLVARLPSPVFESL